MRCPARTWWPGRCPVPGSSGRWPHRLSLLAPGQHDSSPSCPPLRDLETSSWPDRDLWICAVRRGRRRRVVFGRPGSPSAPTSAIAASCAVRPPSLPALRSPQPHLVDAGAPPHRRARPSWSPARPAGRRSRPVRRLGRWSASSPRPGPARSLAVRDLRGATVNYTADVDRRRCAGRSRRARRGAPPGRLSAPAGEPAAPSGPRLDPDVRADQPPRRSPVVANLDAGDAGPAGGRFAPGLLRLPISRTYDLAEAPQALEDFAAGTLGKFAIRVR